MAPPTVHSASTLAERLEAARRLRGLSGRGLARLARLKSESHVGAIEAGDVSDVGVSTCEKLARALGVDPAWLAFGAGAPPS